MLSIIGLGINCDPTLRGIELMKEADEIYYETYTSPIDISKLNALSKKLGKKFVKLERRDLEEDVEKFVARAREKKICLLVGGDPLVATTHISILLEAEKQKVKYEIVHNSSILSAICETGVHSYKIGRVTTIPIKEESFDPESFYEVIEENLKRKLHSLILLEARDETNFVSINEAIERILKLSSERGGIIGENSLALAISRLGYSDQIIRFGRLGKLKRLKFGKPPHSLLLLSDLHFTEEEALSRFLR
ncbi:MAG: diphthine synthase [Candidatus Nanoarchaeia archaeon]|nr:diphthine synthase [Candidatus Haiyanarchaeum thermophilum]MCW1303418.1 diphthine synthase [Candidatus Haiyanarchaeum thermophilum]MCW1303895.1 diphthine synthase [Candidatus Haiyanarchaeum thermophilum]MCW1306880.1 diphthine synthase [Candidatus Haiyanarchaeum thermophilum]MCW1307444.1 diphthine synthase [Candidatus Haiyanarchaeum thermophilum]